MSDVAAKHHPAKAPRRGHYLFATLFFAFIATYGSMVPWKYRPLEFGTAVARLRHNFEEHRPRHFIGGSRTDWAANVLLFIPIGFCATGVLLVDRKGWRRACLGIPVILVGCFALSVAIEFTQCWFPPRVASVSDIAAQTVGVVMSIVLWLAAGQPLTNWLRSYETSATPRGRLDWVLRLYLLGFLIYAVMPLDVTIQPHDLYQKLKNGRIELIPFSHSQLFSLSGLWDVLTNIVLSIPIGAWATTVAFGKDRSSRPAWISILIGAAIVVGVEFAELFVISRSSSATQVLSGTVGVVAGVLIMRRWRPAAEPVAEAAVRPIASRLLLGMAILAYSAFLCAMFWWPLELLRDGAAVRERLQHFFAVPFASTVKSNPFNAITDTVRKLFLFGILGLLWAGLIRTFSPSRTAGTIAVTVAILYCVALVTGIEICQAAFPPRVPEFSDVLVGTTGFVIAMLVMRGRSPKSE